MSTLSRALPPIAWLVVVGVLAQAALAGQALYVDRDLFGLHGGIGHGVLTLSLVAAVLAWIAPVRRSAAVVASLTVLALVAQTGLGYTAHRGGAVAAGSLHIPLGVLILGAAVAVAVLVSVARPEPAVARPEPEGA